MGSYAMRFGNRLVRYGEREGQGTGEYEKAANELLAAQEQA